MSNRPFRDVEGTPRWWHAALTVVVALAVAGCTGAPANTPTAAPAPGTAAPTTTAATTTTTDATVPIVYRIERHATDQATADFTAMVDVTLTDPRGWSKAGFRLEHREDPGAPAPYLIVLAEPDEAEALCRPYDVYRKYSCQLGPTVVINAERWRHATPEWTGDLAAYKQMLVNHEVGHLLGMKHPKPSCPVAGQPARVMSQQSTELNGCLPNPWPLADEIERVGRHDLPLAPPFSR